MPENLEKIRLTYELGELAGFTKIGIASDAGCESVITPLESRKLALRTTSAHFGVSETECLEKIEIVIFLRNDLHGDIFVREKPKP